MTGEGLWTGNHSLTGKNDCYQIVYTISHFQIRTLTDLHGDFCLSIDYLAASAELVVKPDKDIAYCAPVVQKGA